MTKCPTYQRFFENGNSYAEQYQQMAPNLERPTQHEQHSNYETNHQEPYQPTNLTCAALSQHHWLIENAERLQFLDGYQYQLDRSEEHTSELQSRPHLVCRLLLE